MNYIVSSQTNIDEIISEHGRLKPSSEKFLEFKYFSFYFDENLNTKNIEQRRNLENYLKGLNNIDFELLKLPILKNVDLLEEDEKTYNEFKAVTSNYNTSLITFKSLNYKDFDFEDFDCVFFEDSYNTIIRNVEFNEIISNFQNEQLKPLSNSQSTIILERQKKYILESKYFLEQYLSNDNKEISYFFPENLQHLFFVNSVREFVGNLMLSFTNEVYNELFRTQSFSANVPSKDNHSKLEYSSPIFRDKDAEEWFFNALKELNAIDDTNTYVRGFNAKIHAIFKNQKCKDFIFKYDLSQKNFVDYLNTRFSIDMNPTRLSSPYLHEVKVENIVKLNPNIFSPNKSE